MANEWQIKIPVLDKMEPAWGLSEIFAMVAEMKAGFEETLSKKEKELDNAKETILSLKQQIKRMENGGEILIVDSISEGMDKERPSYYQKQKFGFGWNESELSLYSDSGMESMATDTQTSSSGKSFSPADTSVSPAVTPFSPAVTPFSPADTPFSPADTSVSPADTFFLLLLILLSPE